jgi:hypothetical protein
MRNCVFYCVDCRVTSENRILTVPIESFSVAGYQREGYQQISLFQRWFGGQQRGLCKKVYREIQQEPSEERFISGRLIGAISRLLIN